MGDRSTEYCPDAQSSQVCVTFDAKRPAQQLKQLVASLAAIGTVPGAHSEHRTPAALTLPLVHLSQPSRARLACRPGAHARQRVESECMAAPPNEQLAHVVEPYNASGAHPTGQGSHVPPLPARPAAQAVHPTPLGSAANPSPHVAHAVDCARAKRPAGQSMHR